jgi:phage gpG-like protein
MSVHGEENAKEVADELRKELQAMRRNLRSTVFRALTMLETEIIKNLQGASGLHVRSGALLKSIGASKQVIEEGDGTLSGQIGPQGIPYAAIHEFGGTTKPHEIRARNAKALAWAKIGPAEKGKSFMNFAKVVHHPGSKIPARPYLAPALAAKKDKILETFGIFIEMSFKPKG